MSARRKYNRRVYFAYSVLLALALVLTSPWWLLNMLRHGKYRAGLGERLGIVPRRLSDPIAHETIWIHAVSVGEVLAVSRIVEELKARLPGSRVVISTTTETGQKLARQRFGENEVFYFPLDLPFSVRAYLKALRPSLLVLAESEFWPNLLHQAHESGASVTVVNARVSDRSLPRYLRFRGLLARVMKNVDIFVAQSDEDARRLVQIGAPPKRVRSGGNLKFEVIAPMETPIVRAFAAAVRHGTIGPVLVAGSTLEGEEALLLDCFRRVFEAYPNALMILAPRHPERFDAVVDLLKDSGLLWQRRSQCGGQGLVGSGIFLLDTIGELAGLYQFADVAFVGGSLVPKGGHNVLEAAQFGVAILVGSHTENFREIIGLFQQADALRVATQETLTDTVLELLSDDNLRFSMGSRARALMCATEGATTTTVEVLLTLLNTGSAIRAGEVFSERRV